MRFYSHIFLYYNNICIDYEKGGIKIIKVNGRDFEWEKDLTVSKLLELKKYTFPKIIVRINDEFISKNEYSTTLINDGDDVKVIHLMAGG